MEEKRNINCSAGACEKGFKTMCGGQALIEGIMMRGPKKQAVVVRKPDGELDVQLLGRGFAWLDTGTMDSLVEAADFVRMVEKRQGIKISAPEEIAYKNGWITKDKLMESAERYGKSPYGAHLKAVAEGRVRY